MDYRYPFSVDITLIIPPALTCQICASRNNKDDIATLVYGDLVIEPGT